MKNDTRIRRYDRVRIVNPVRFIRCGYNLCVEDVADKLFKEKHEEITAFLTSLGFSKNYLYTTKDNHFKEVPARKYKSLLNKLAYTLVGAQGFGGGERKIFTEPLEESFRGTEWVVQAIAIHKTGHYFPSSGGYDSYNGEYYYETGGLSDMKTHKVLLLGKKQEWVSLDSWKDKDALKMLATDVEKI